MSAKRVVARCPDCGAEISVPVNVVGRARCGACRAERARADKRALYRAHKEAKKGTASGIMALLAQKRQLQECPRLHVRATSLPCGRRPECFGKIRCDKCPAGAAPPSGLDNPWAENVVGW